ncbi:MAG: hypothetical protein ACOCVU_02140 [Desulfohalobiaceae bacterium]
MPSSTESTWEQLAEKLQALFAHKVSLGPLSSGDGLVLEVENISGDCSKILFSTEHLPHIAVSLLRGHQIAASNLPGEQLVQMLERSQKTQMENPVAARSAWVVNSPGTENLSLLIHCGTSFLHFTLPEDAVRELRDELNRTLPG